MSRVATMLRAVRRAHTLRGPDAPRQFRLVLFEDEAIPPWVQEMVREQDSIVVRYVPGDGYMPMDDVSGQSYGVMITQPGHVAVLYRDGRMEWRP